MLNLFYFTTFSVLLSQYYFLSTTFSVLLHYLLSPCGRINTSHTDFVLMNLFGSKSLHQFLFQSQELSFCQWVGVDKSGQVVFRYVFQVVGASDEEEGVSVFGSATTIRIEHVF